MCSRYSPSLRDLTMASAGVFAAVGAAVAGIEYLRRSSRSAAAGAGAGAGAGSSDGGAPRRKVVMVTGGRGLVGMGIQTWLEKHPEQRGDEKWVFLSSKDGDLR